MQNNNDPHGDTLQEGTKPAWTTAKRVATQKGQLTGGFVVETTAICGPGRT